MCKKIALILVIGTLVAACAHPLTPVTEDSLTYRQQGLSATAISAGACDDVGQYIPAASQSERVRLEASAAPTR